jgi:hypothetical protein
MCNVILLMLFRGKLITRRTHLFLFSVVEPFPVLVNCLVVLAFSLESFNSKKNSAEC